MMYFHGTDDFVCPYEGTGPEWYDPPREETARRWARHNRCANEDPEIEQVSELAQRWVWSGCTAPTEYYKIEDFGHTWPGCAQPPSLPIPPLPGQILSSPLVAAACAEAEQGCIRIAEGDGCAGRLGRAAPGSWRVSCSGTSSGWPREATAAQGRTGLARDENVHKR